MKARFDYSETRDKTLIFRTDLTVILEWLTIMVPAKTVILRQAIPITTLCSPAQAPGMP